MSRQPLLDTRPLCSTVQLSAASCYFRRSQRSQERTQMRMWITNSENIFPCGISVRRPPGFRIDPASCCAPVSHPVYAPVRPNRSGSRLAHPIRPMLSLYLNKQVRRHNGGPDPPQVGGVKAVPETAKQRPKRNVGIVARRAIERASAGRSASIQTNPGPTELNMEPAPHALC